ncbi:MAG: adenylate/guanylate cyclase domain-containing protein [Alphaproteobacteria bacterium]|nr:adenylate/guanylate cyclase domain-containing protein [Alphaproteobacteria bacterium]MCB9929276.1 adenylate/guanylate cyclase domain-containing protein [Alphaproteobacteria bacterium]
MTPASRRRPHIPRRHLVLVAVGALVFALWRVFAGDPVTDLAEARLLDLRFRLRGPIAPPDSVVIAAIDEAAIDRLGWSPPPRAAIAAAVRTILSAGPRVVALDLLFLDRTDADAALAAALAPGDRVILGTAVGSALRNPATERPPGLVRALQRSVFGVVIDAPASGGPASAGPAPRLFAPLPEILGHATLGHVNISRADDTVAREIPLALRIGAQGYLPALSVEAARRLLNLTRGEVAWQPGRGLRLGPREIGTDRAGAVPLDHYGPGGTIPTVSLLDVLDGRAPPAVFRGRAVFIGASAESLSDRFATPFGTDTPGAEVLATLTANLVAGDLIRHGPRTAVLGTALAIALAVALFYAARARSPAMALAMAAAVWLAGAAAVQLAFERGNLWLDATAILATLLGASAWCMAQRLRAERRLAVRLEIERHNLSRYQSPVLVTYLSEGARPAFEGRTQDAGVLFVDAAGYTTLVEKASPAETAAFLRELHRLYEDCATDHRGVIVSFEGDGALIVFGLPDPRPDDGASALMCGLQLLNAATGFRSEVFPGQPLRLRVSVQYGPVTVAVLGGRDHAQITITGDTVNVASRLQDIAKAHGVTFVTGRPAIDAARAAGAEVTGLFARLAEEPIRGRSQSVEVWAPQS